MLLVQPLVLQLHVVELGVLLFAAGLEQIGQVVDSVPKLLVHLLEVGLSRLLELLELELQLRLLLLLAVQLLLEQIQIALP